MPLVPLTRLPESEPGTLPLTRGEFSYAPLCGADRRPNRRRGLVCGGLIHGLLDGNLDLAICLGAFAAAIGLATPGDINYLGPEDIVQFRADTIGGIAH